MQTHSVGGLWCCFTGEETKTPDRGQNESAEEESSREYSVPYFVSTGVGLIVSQGKREWPPCGLSGSNPVGAFKKTKILGGGGARP